jgi:WD40 repeat protein
VALLSFPERDPVQKGEPGPAEARDRYGDPLPDGARARLGSSRLRAFAQDLAFTPDGKVLATAGAPRVHLWDAHTGRHLRQFERSEGWVSAVAVSADGTRLADGGEDKVVRVWDLRTGQRLLSLTGHAQQVNGVAFSPDGKTLASYCGRGEIMLWDLGTGKALHRHAVGGVGRLAFSPDGKLLAWGTSGGLICLKDVATWEERPPLRGHKSGVTGVQYFDDGRRLLSSGVDGTVRVWDLASGKEMRRFSGPQGNIRSLALSPDGKSVAAGCSKGLVVVWDFASGRVVRRIDQGGQMTVPVVRYSPDGKVLATARSFVVRLWDAATGEPLVPLEDPASSPRALAFSPDGHKLATTGDTYLRVWDVATAKVAHRLRGTTGRWSAVAFSPDGRLLAGADGYKAAPRVWETATWQERHTLPRQAQWVEDLTFFQDGKGLAFACVPDILVYDLATGQKRFTFKTKLGQFRHLAGSPRGTTLVGMDQDGGFTFWDQATGAAVHQLRFRGGSPENFAVSPDGKTVACATTAPEPDIRLLEAATGAERLRLAGYAPVAFSPDGRYVAAVDFAESLRVWDALTGEERAMLDGHMARVVSLAFSPDGKTLASGSVDTTVLLWDVPRILKKPTQQIPPLAEKELAGLWDGLAGEDAKEAYRSLARLVDAGEVEPFLKAALRKSGNPAAAEVGRLIKDLDSSVFATRERATAGLARLGGRAVPAIRKALRENPSPEQARRLEGLLAAVSKAGVDRGLVRMLRAVEVLEHRGTPSSRRLLEELAAGDAGDALCQEARASLSRLDGRPTGRGPGTAPGR